MQVVITPEEVEQLKKDYGFKDVVDIVPLVKDGESYCFEAVITKVEEHFVEATVMECGAWGEGSTKGVYDVPDRSFVEFPACGPYEVVLEGYVKWDGCSHINFTARPGNRHDECSKGEMRYLHLCGRENWVSYSQMLLELYDLLARTMGDHYAAWCGGELGEVK